MLITITLVAFLVLLLVAFASLTRVETRVADNSQRLAQARAHALLSLNTALGELQEFAGPDQRATAGAGLGATADNTHPVAADGTRHWTGVWGNANSADNDRSAPVFLNWLVSGNESVGVQTNADGSIASDPATPARRPEQGAGNLANADALSTNLTVGGQPSRLLVGPGTVGLTSEGGLGSAGYVVAPLENITVPAELVPGQGGSSPVTIGRYAWWVGDEGVKARAELVPDEATISTTNDAERRLRYRVPARGGIELMANAPTALASADLEGAAMASLREELRKVLTPGQLALTAGGVPFPPAFTKHRFHDLTTTSRGVLSDALSGGLRQDLTAALAPGTGKNDAPAGPLWRLGTNDETIGPDWQLLRSFYQLPSSTGATGSGASLALAPRPHLDGITDTTRPAQHGIFPLVAYWQWHVEGRVTSLGTASCGLELRYYPALVLWNPYNVTLRDHDYHLTYSLNGGQITFIRVSARTADPQVYTRVPPAISAEAQVSTPWRDGIRVTVRSGDMEPGAAYVYTLPSNVYFNSDTFASYVLTRGWHSGGTHSVIIGGNTFPLPGGDTSKFMVSLWSGTNHSGDNTIPSWDTQTQVVPSSPPSGSGTEPALRDDELILATSSGETLQHIRGNNNYEHSVKMRWVRNSLLYQDLRPAVGYLGHRWALKTTAPGTLGDTTGYYKNYPVRWLADYNPRAPFSVRPPHEMQSTGIGGGGFDTNPSFNYSRAATRYAAGAFDPVNADAAIPHDPDNGRAFVGMSQSSWEGADASTVVLFNVPRADHPVVSLGELQHAQLYRDNGVPHLSNTSPAYAVGNSLAPPRGNLDASSKPWTEIAIGSNGYQTYRANSHVFDHSRILNRALWDRYFFSTVPTGAAADPVVFPLANPHLSPASESGEYASDLRDRERAAARLLVSGAFNINSTSVQAWRALLGGLNNVPVGNNRRANESPYPRLGYPNDDNAVLNVGSTSNAGLRADAYAGYRFLTTAQINSLADEIVRQVRRRGPFLSLSDFVNRALDAGPVPGTQDNRLKGALAQAIENAALNSAFASGQQAITPPAGGSGNTAINATVGAGPTATNVPGWLTQADLLQPLGSVIASRSDTFLVRAYGEVLNPVLASTDPNYVQGRAWCEAVVQRMPEYVSDANDPWVSGAALSADNRAFGRRFQVVYFRWLTPADI